MPYLFRKLPTVTRVHRKNLSGAPVGLSAHITLMLKAFPASSQVTALAAHVTTMLKEQPGATYATALAAHVTTMLKEHSQSTQTTALAAHVTTQAKSNPAMQPATALATHISTMMKGIPLATYPSPLSVMIHFQMVLNMLQSIRVPTANIVVIDDVYGSEAISRINSPIVATTATILQPTIVYISAGSRILNMTDTFAIELTKPDGKIVQITTNIQIGTQNFFAGVGRFVPNTYVICVISSNLIDQRGTYGVQLLVDGLALSRVGNFNVG